MAFDGVIEQNLILARARTLFGGRFHDGLPASELLATDANGVIRPYGIVWFGEMYDTQSDRSITGEEQQPVIMPITFECWAANPATTRSMAGAVRVLFRGWQPNENASLIRLRGGGAFDPDDNSGRPARFMRAVSAETTLNMSVDTAGSMP